MATQTNGSGPQLSPEDVARLKHMAEQLEIVHYLMLGFLTQAHELEALVARVTALEEFAGGDDDPDAVAYGPREAVAS